jgi:hypothetical protein
MAQSNGSIYEVRWNEVCPWLILVKAWRVSLLVRVLAYAWLGLLLTQWGWWAAEKLGADQAELDGNQVRTSFTTIDRSAIDIREQKASERRLLARSLFQVDPQLSTDLRRPMRYRDPRPLLWLRDHWREHGFGPLVEGWRSLNLPFIKVFQFETNFGDAVRLLLCGVWAIAVWALFGGAIARTAAQFCAREEIITPISAGRTAVRNWPSTAGGPLIVLLFSLLLTVPLALIGLVFRADLLALVGGLLWVLIIAWGLGLAIVLFALWFGWPLMWATIAVEQSDAFDAASRAAAYVYQRPLRLAFYVIVATVLGMFGQLIVLGFAAAADHLADWAISWGAGTDRIVELTSLPAEDVESTLSSSAEFGALAIDFWKRMLDTFAAAYPLAYLFSSSVGIYLLLRLDIDSTEMDEIAADDSEDAIPHEPHLDNSSASAIN